MASFFFEGCRVRDQEGFKATVRYVGPVIAAKDKTEVWLGVEWDDKSRGKHDGSCVDESGQIHRYFKCDYGAGSFVKPAKVALGRTLSDALRERYVDLNAPTILKEDSAALPDAFFTTSKGNQKSIEFVGEKKIRKHQQISTIQKVSVRNDYVSRAGDDLNAIAGHLTEVDLQENLICQWQEIGNFGVALPLLTTLLLHGNKLEPLTAELAEYLRAHNCLAGLEVLALNGCGIRSWTTLQHLHNFLPNLQELYLSNNDLSDLPGADENGQVSAVFVSEFPKLRILDVSFCQISDWSQLQAFGRLPALKELVLDGNPLSSLPAPAPDTFLELQRLSLGSTGVAAWSEIDNLAAFPAVSVLRISQVPLFHGKGASEVRPFVIARVVNLAVLNGSVISPRERRDSEKLYLRAVLMEKARLAKDQPTRGEEELQHLLVLQHPRYLSLKETYEKELFLPANAAASQPGERNLAAEMISLVLANMIVGAAGPCEPVAKRLPLSLTVGKLRLVVKQLFQVEPSSQCLALRAYKDSIPLELEDDQATLQYYGAIDGAEIFINEK